MMVFVVLFLSNSLGEYLLNRVMFEMNILEKKNRVYHGICAMLRIMWIFLCAWLCVPIPLMLIGLFSLLFLNVVLYRKRAILLNNFNMIIFLLYTSLLMMVIGVAGLLGTDVAHVSENTNLRPIVFNTTFLLFNLACFLLLRFRPIVLWKEDYDRLKVLIYTRFLLACSVYHIFDAVLLTRHDISWVNYLLLVLGDILILILIFNFLSYNSVFTKSEELKRKYIENEVMLAQQYFEKEALKKLSELDSLTNAYNRREISSIMQENINNGKNVICVFIDLDGLKLTNDKYGHNYGDMMLKKFADVSTEIIDNKGYLARIGGDEFLLVFVDWEISAVEECIQKLQSKLLDSADEKEKIHFSYGIADKEETVEDFIKTADRKMYECKKGKWRGEI